MLNNMLYAGSSAFFPNWTGKLQVFAWLASVFYKTREEAQCYSYRMVQPRKVSVAEVEARGQEWLCQVMQQVEKTLKWHSSLRVFVGMSCIALQPGWGEGWAVNLESYIPCNITII